jgi:hypothetical protein
MLKNKNPAELARGLVFQENFESAANINLNGGVITGALEYRDRGAVFSGAVNTVKYGGALTFKRSPTISMVIEFTPDFNFDDNVVKTFCDTTVGTRYSLLKYSNATSNLLRFYCGGVNAISVTSAAYGPYWKTNQRNVFVITCASGSNFVYLNGVQVGTSATAWSPIDITAFEIGANSFSGVMHSFKIFNQVLTAGEALGYYNNDWANYEKRATCILPMTAECHDATGLKTLDVSGKGKNAVFGDGSTATKFPTKLQRRGYSFDGGDYLQAANAGLVGASGLTIFAVLRNSPLGSQAVAGIEKVDSTTIAGLLYKPDTTSFRFYAGSSTAVNAANITAGLSAVNVVVGVTTGSVTSIYCNGKLGTNAATPIALAQDAAQLFTVGARGSAGTPLIGDVLASGYFPFALTPLQIADLTLKLQKNINLI